jgi:squalene-hopene/tetraprenyl-beta-curcumene cyclase
VWLLDLQNRDGGIPTFCRGWGRLPFDRSSPDLTAHAVRSWAAWGQQLPATLRSRVTRATRAAVAYLLAEQRADGTWIPLWFGNQHEPDLANPVYGTSRVLLASNPRGLDATLETDWRRSVERGARALVALQKADGGWGGGPASPATLEETGLAVTALAAHADDAEAGTAVVAGVEWIVRASGGGQHFEPSPIGLYFAKLWYSERLYPWIFSVAALEAAASART